TALLINASSRRAPERDGFEKRIAEHTVGRGGAIQVTHALVEALRFRKPGREGGLAHALDHGREGAAGEALDELRAARVDVHHARRDAHRVEARLDEKRIQLAADERVAARTALQLDLAVDRLARSRALRMKVRGAVVAFDHGDGAAWTQ